MFRKTEIGDRQTSAYGPYLMIKIRRIQPSVFNAFHKPAIINHLAFDELAEVDARV
jgi:hypothetical protein